MKPIVALIGLFIPDNTAINITNESQTNPIADILLWYGTVLNFSSENYIYCKLIGKIDQP